MRAATRAVVEELRAVADLSRLPGMARVGIVVDRALGVSIPNLRRIARRHRGDHALAMDLWTTGIHEARILASMVDDPEDVTRAQMRDWASGFDSWDVCAQVCSNLFIETTHAFPVAKEWVRREAGFVKRAGFALIAVGAARDRERADAFWLGWLPAIRRGAVDDRNEVKKAVSWALRQIGKRNLALNRASIAEAETLASSGSSPARWIGRDALRELRSDAVQARLRSGGRAGRT